MDARIIDKSKLPSRHVTQGPERAPHRSYLYAMGLTTQQINQPLVGVATCWNEAAPCNISLMRQAQSVKKGVASAGGTPREFCTITVTDGIAMGHAGMKASLPSREVIADSVELTMRGHAYDALVGMAGCDKSLPGMMMAMVRLNVPRSSSTAARSSPAPSRAAPSPCRTCSRPSAATPSATCRTRPRGAGAGGLPVGGCLRRAVHRQHHGDRLEAIGLACPIRRARPRPTSCATGSACTAGEMVMDLVRQEHPPPRHRHPQIAGERRHGGRGLGRLDECRPAPARHRARGRASVFDLFDVAEIFKRTPYIADLKPGGRYVPRTCSRSAASRSVSRRCSTAASCTATA
jgi:dihydroxy-acid dehydratase